MSNHLHVTARCAEAMLEEIVLTVVHEAQRAGTPLTPAEISRSAGIFRESGYAKKSGNDDIAWGILGKLVKAGRIEKSDLKPAAWVLTDKELDARTGKKKRN